MPKSRDPLTEKQRVACRELLTGCTQAEAFVRAGYSAKFAYQNATRLFKRPECQAYLAELREKAEGRAIDARQAHLDKLAELRDAAAEDKQFGAAVTAETNIGKVHKLYTEKHELSGPGGSPLKFEATIRVIRADAQD